MKSVVDQSSCPSLLRLLPQYRLILGWTERDNREVRQNIFRKEPPRLSRIDRRNQWSARKHGIELGCAVDAYDSLKFSIANLFEQCERQDMMRMSRDRGSHQHRGIAINLHEQTL